MQKPVTTMDAQCSGALPSVQRSSLLGIAGGVPEWRETQSTALAIDHRIEIAEHLEQGREVLRQDEFIM
jgi:hypothetical protein